jgi:hypothetical protein
LRGGGLVYGVICSRRRGLRLVLGAAAFLGEARLGSGRGFEAIAEGGVGEATGREMGGGLGVGWRPTPEGAAFGQPFLFAAILGKVIDIATAWSNI